MDFYYVSILPSSIEVLKGKLIKRGRESIDIINQRIKDNVAEFNLIKNSNIFDEHLVWDHFSFKESKIQLLDVINKLYGINLQMPIKDLFVDEEEINHIKYTLNPLYI